MNKNEQLDQWCKARYGRMQELANAMGFSKQYIFDLRKKTSGISDARWKQILKAMEAIV